MLECSPWKSCLIDVSVDDQLSEEVNLGDNYSHLLVLIPTIDSATISVRVSDSDKSGGTFYPIHDFLDSDADNTVLQATTAGTGGIAAIFKIGGVSRIKLYAGAAQSADKTFKVRGIRKSL